MNALVQTAGVHGYSSPCPNHIVFSSTHLPNHMRIDSVRLLIADHLIVGRGAYNGQHEEAYSLPDAVFYEMVRRFPFITRGQESILILGSPQARNWRPATLRFIDGSGRADVDLGVWRSVTEEQAFSNDNWSYFNGHYFICEIDPPANMYEAEQREVQKKLAALESILTTLHTHFGIPLDDATTVAGALDDMLKSKYDEAVNAGIYAVQNNGS